MSRVRIPAGPLGKGVWGKPYAGFPPESVKVLGLNAIFRPRAPRVPRELGSSVAGDPTAAILGHVLIHELLC